MDTLIRCDLQSVVQNPMIVLYLKPIGWKKCKKTSIAALLGGKNTKAHCMEKVYK